MSPDVLLAAADRRLRAPLRAQLIEEGYGVLAVASWDEAELLLSKRAAQPRVVVVDLDAESNPAAILPTLARLVAPATVIVLTSAGAPNAADAGAHGLEHVMARPFSIGEVVERVRSLIGRS